MNVAIIVRDLHPVIGGGAFTLELHVVTSTGQEVSVDAPLNLADSAQTRQNTIAQTVKDALLSACGLTVTAQDTVKIFGGT